MSAPHNPQAFPHMEPRDPSFTFTQNGMTLRDWFAGQALSAAWDACDKGYVEGGNAEIARCAYQLADAMLAARGDA